MEEGGMEGGKGEGEKHEVILFLRLELQSLTYKAGGGLSTTACSFPNSRRRLLGCLALECP